MSPEPFSAGSHQPSDDVLTEPPPAVGPRPNARGPLTVGQGTPSPLTDAEDWVLDSPIPSRHPGDSSESAYPPVTASLGTFPPPSDIMSWADRRVVVVPPLRSAQPRGQSGFPAAEAPTLQTQFAPSRDNAVASEYPGRYVHLRTAHIPMLGSVSIVQDCHLERVVALRELASLGQVAGVGVGGRDGEPVPGIGAVDSAPDLMREVMISAGLEHPGLLPIYELGRRADGTSYFTCPAILGRTLRALLLERQSLGARLRLLPELLRVFEAVAFAHQRGVVHRNLSADCIVVGDGGLVSVLGWRYALVGGETDLAASALRRELERRRVEDPNGLAPEQWRLEITTIGIGTDVFALGALLWWVISGAALEPPRTAGAAHQEWGPPAATLDPRCPPGLVDLAISALAWEPGTRPKDVSVLVERLRDCWSDSLCRNAPSSVGSGMGFPGPRLAELPLSPGRQPAAATRHNVHVALRALLALGIAGLLFASGWLIHRWPF